MICRSLVHVGGGGGGHWGLVWWWWCSLEVWYGGGGARWRSDKLRGGRQRLGKLLRGRRSASEVA